MGILKNMKFDGINALILSRRQKKIVGQDSIIVASLMKRWSRDPKYL